MINENKKIINSSDDLIMSYLKALLEKKGMSDLPAEILADMLMDLYSRFEGFLLTNVVKEMDAETSRKFDEFLKNSPSVEDSMEFLKENFGDIQGIIKKSLLEFEKIYLGE